MTNGIEVGTIVEYPRQPGWGPGKVVHIGQRLLHVFFRDAEGHEARRLAPDQVRVAAAQSDPVLDNLPSFVQEGRAFVLKRRDRLTPDQAIARFLQKYPRGFEDPDYIGKETGRLRGERAYKLGAHRVYCDMLRGSPLQELLAAGDAAELAARALQAIGKVNLLFANEAVAFREALEAGTGVIDYFRALDRLLELDTPESFDAYVSALAALRPRGPTSTNKWPIATLFPFLARPDRHIFVKPTVVKEAADRLAFDIMYDARPNSRTYWAVRRMCDAYRTKLEPLEPEDNIDVTSFLWVVSSNFEKTAAKHRRRR